MWKNSNRAAVATVTSVGKARRHWRAADWNFRGISSGHVAVGFMPAFKHDQRILLAVFERGHKAHGYVHSGTFRQTWTQSCRKAHMGSTREARRAGTAAASRVVSINPTGARTRATGSKGARGFAADANARLEVRLNTSPMPMPVRLSIAASLKIIFITPRWSAPTATRIPISRVFRET